jgi:hypothetical protein
VVSSVRSLGSSRVCPSATKTFKAALRSYGDLGQDRQRNQGFFSGLDRGVSTPREGSKILTFLFRPRLVYSSLLHLLSSWKRSSPKFGDELLRIIDNAHRAVAPNPAKAPMG